MGFDQMIRKIPVSHKHPDFKVAAAFTFSFIFGKTFTFLSALFRSEPCQMIADQMLVIAFRNTFITVVYFE